MSWFWWGDANQVGDAYGEKKSHPNDSRAGLQGGKESLEKKSRGSDTSSAEMKKNQRPGSSFLGKKFRLCGR